MYLKNIKLTNFRNYKQLDIEIDKNTNVFYGKNASGKTNILESIYISSITKSYRAFKETECINFDEDFFRIENLYIGDNDVSKNIEVFLDKDGKKEIKESGVSIKKYSEYIGKIPLVLFSPEKIDIVKGSPKNRRKFIDILISQVSKKYIICLQEYNKLLKLKNNILKENKKQMDEKYLDVLDEQLSEKILYITNKRKEYIEKIQEESNIIEKVLSKTRENIELKYITDFENLEKRDIVEFLKKARKSDIFRNTSTKGIGRDEILILVNEKEVSKYGSQGQNRTAALSLKLAEVEILKKEKDRKPIILLDDVFSELDEERIKILLEYIKDYQSIITTTEINNIKENIKGTFFKVTKGMVEKE